MIRHSTITLTGGTLFIAIALLFACLLRGEDNYPKPDALASATPYKNTFFDPDPNHPWNQLYGLLFIRPAWDGKPYGLDEMDPLYWEDTTYLLEEPLHGKALALLDDFIKNDAAHLIKDPLKRALLQRMLWALFDRWSFRAFDRYDGRTFDSERRELQTRLVKIMKGVALTDDEIKALPDNYKLEADAKTYPATFDSTRPDVPFLPDNFFSRANWINLNDEANGQLAPVHVEGVSGRSGFDILISLPTGRNDTLAYLEKLNDFEPHWIYDRSKRSGIIDRGVIDPPWLNPDLPQVPLLTKFALVRHANLIDAKGELVQSPIIESVQIRVIRTILPNNSSGGEQSFFLFTLDQKKLMEGEGGLAAQGQTTPGFDLVLRSYDDPLQNRNEREPGPEFQRVENCFSCHNAPGIFSMNSYVQFFQSHRTLKPPKLAEGGSSAGSLAWKKDQYSWGLLQACWHLQ